MSDFKILTDTINNHNCKLIAVSKTQSVEAILKIYKLGQRDFGENRVQELLEKQAELPDDINWHLIGHLQKNKVKYITPFIHMIHSADNLELLDTIDKKAQDSERKINILLQIKIAEEDTKYGFDFNDLINNFQPSDYQNLNFKGVMGMATFTDDQSKIRKEFQKLVTYKRLLNEKFFRNELLFSEISMGMSGDYEIAMEEGSTMVRIGSLIFGERNKN